MTETTAGLAGVLKRGAAMSAVGLVISQAATVIQTLVLGRILGPHEVGVFAAGSVMIGFLSVAAGGALSQALIHRKTDVEDAANTVLVVTFGTGLLGGLALLAASPLIGTLFDSSRVGLIAAATSGLMVLHVCASVPDALMKRAFQFKPQMIITPASSITFAAVSIVFAIRGYGAWAMVIGWYASTTTTVVLSWWMAKSRLFRGRFSFRIWREMAGFSLPLLLDNLADRSREMFEQMIVGGTRNRRFGSVPVRIPHRLAAVTDSHHDLFPRAVPRLFADFRRQQPVPGSLPSRTLLDLVRRASRWCATGCHGPASGGVAARRGMAFGRGRRRGDGGNRAGRGAPLGDLGGDQGRGSFIAAELVDGAQCWTRSCH